jgi:hypothetical protein
MYPFVPLMRQMVLPEIAAFTVDGKPLIASGTGTL